MNGRFVLKVYLKGVTAKMHQSEVSSPNKESYLERHHLSVFQDTMYKVVSMKYQAIVDVHEWRGGGETILCFLG